MSPAEIRAIVLGIAGQANALATATGERIEVRLGVSDVVADAMAELEGATIKRYLYRRGGPDSTGKPRDRDYVIQDVTYKLGAVAIGAQRVQEPATPEDLLAPGGVTIRRRQPEVVDVG